MSRRDTIAFASILALMILLALLSNSSAATDPSDVRASSFLSSPGGTAALFMVLEELGIPTERRLDPFVDMGPAGGSIAILAPSQPLAGSEVEVVLRWVEDGGTLLYAARMGDGVATGLGLEVVFLPPSSLADLRSWRGDTAYATPHALTTDIETVRGFRFAFRRPSGPGAEPLLQVDEGRIVAVRLPRGRGQVFAFSDASPLVNARVGEGGAALLFARAAQAGGGGVVFDEYHHGFRSDGSPAGVLRRFLLQTDPGRALLQLVLAALALLLLLGTRFGAPVPAPPAQRRDPLEHVEALAAAYRRAGARRTAQMLLMNGLVRRLGRHQHGVQPEAVLEALRRSSTAPVSEAVAELETEWKKKDAADLVLVARRMDEILTTADRNR